jgi:hypothetical protein
MSTIESIVRELEQIPEPMQLSVLDFIRSLSSSNTGTNPTGEVNQNQHPSGKRRTTSALIAGKGKTVGDIVSPIVDEQDWECLK